jgi:hypothetical protein
MRRRVRETLGRDTSQSSGRYVVDVKQKREEVEEAPYTEELQDDQGVDLTAIRWMLRRSPTARLDYLQQHMQAVWEIRRENAS